MSSESNNVNQRADALMGRRINAIDDEELWRMVPVSSRFSIYEYLLAVHDRDEQGTLFDNVDSICDGAGNRSADELCHELQGLHGAADALNIARQVPGLSPVLTHPMVGSRLVEDNNLREFWASGTVDTVEGAILNRVEAMEHQLHHIGRRMDRRDGSAYARNLIVRWMLLFELMFNVPVVQAAGQKTLSWDSFSVWLMLNWSLISTAAVRNANFAMKYVIVMLQGLTIKFGDWYIGDTVEDCYFWSPEPSVCWVGSWASKLYLPTYFKQSAIVGFHDFVDYHLDKIAWLAVVLCLIAGLFTLFLIWRVLSLVYSIPSRLRAKRMAALIAESVSEVGVNDEKADHSELARVSLVLQKGVSKMCPADMFEMSQKGSQVSESSYIPGLLQLIKVCGDVTMCVGIAFRFGDYIVTVEHNIACLESKPGKNIIVPFIERDGKCVFDSKRHLELTDEHISKDIVPSVIKNMFDLAIIPMGNREFSRLGVQSLACADAIWGSTVTVVGLTKGCSNVLQRSVGTILRTPEDSPCKVFYNASTVPGWSGSPVLIKKKIVAMHAGTTGKVNYGWNFVMVLVVIRNHEKIVLEATPDLKQLAYEAEFRDADGHEATFDDLGVYDDDDFGYLTRSNRTGKVGHMAREPVANWINWKSSTGQNWADATYDDEPEAINIGYSNECAVLPESRPRIEIPAQSEHVMVLSPPTPKPEPPFAYLDGTALEKVSTQLRLSSPFFKGLPEDCQIGIDMDQARRLGYVEGKYVWPPAKNYEEASRRSTRSLSNYLKKSMETLNNGWIPSDDVRANAIKIVSDVMKPARFVTDCSGVTKDKIIAQLNSNLVCGSKSPGLPFVPQFQNNSQVIAHYGVEGLAELVLQHWEEGTWADLASVNFIKLEPTKASKIDEGLDRCIQSVSLVIQLIFRCFMGDMHDALAAVQGKVPILMGWCPTNPGHAELATDRVLGSGKNRLKGKTLAYDGVAFEYTSHMQWNYEDVTKCMASLFIPGKGKESEFGKFLADFLRFMDGVGRTGIRCADGSLIKKVFAWILASGRYDTYVRNSFTGLYNDVVAKILAGCSADLIKRLLARAIFGGDDNTQKATDEYDVDLFLSMFKKMGFPIHEVSLTDPKDGFEFFSWKFTFDSCGMPVFKPTRFTKHVENLLACKHEHRPEAVRCLMMLWVHDVDKFTFFRDVFMMGHDRDPDSYRLELLVERMQFLNYIRGNESLCSMEFPHFVEDENGSMNFL